MVAQSLLVQMHQSGRVRSFVIRNDHGNVLRFRQNQTTCGRDSEFFGGPAPFSYRPIARQCGSPIGLHSGKNPAVNTNQAGISVDDLLTDFHGSRLPVVGTNVTRPPPMARPTMMIIRFSLNYSLSQCLPLTLT